ncbi:cell division protein ZapE [Meridianimarinicoccus aquatilis]|uniref:Cell division protein ZapE n=1 Tax=Meridianimarinicoccus aquatilis TaxID=2552766 RepID=A0A4R6AUA8_9RHOB|nr:cell division protein ZapE [Fluviibacterium aquatile]QIE40839.1 cell division protein ZapE [Rhodobacteraceae bacterium SC52]TDL85796.1 cell division protein ZapE [Fluviibacterium aquatile]
MVELKYIYATRAAEGTIKADPAQESVLPELERIRQELAAPPPKRGFFGRSPKPVPIKGLYLWGGVGRGKSYLMDLFVTHVGVPKRRVHFHAFMQEIHAGMTEARKRGVDDALAPVADKLVAELRLLAFDEMQITDITDAMIVGRLFERLFEGGVVIVTTSNRHPDELYKDGLNRSLFLPFIETIKDQLVVWELTSPTDYRQDRLEGMQVYFHPADAAARASVDDLWHEMTQTPRARANITEAQQKMQQRGVGLANDEGLTLKVKGREVHLPRFRAGVARVSFWDLCGVPLGPADYLAVAEAVRVLILEDVPRLGISNFNEAKRFVTLVDTLYEAGTRLVVTAADAPERLYVEGSGAFEFERTASRLREMQSVEWAAQG